jgi:hypothetical protein
MTLQVTMKVLGFSLETLKLSSTHHTFITAQSCSERKSTRSRFNAHAHRIDRLPPRRVHHFTCGSTKRASTNRNYESRPLKVVISTGDVMGDTHAASLARSLYKFGAANNIEVEVMTLSLSRQRTLCKLETEKNGKSEHGRTD